MSVSVSNTKQKIESTSNGLIRFTSSVKGDSISISYDPSIFDRLGMVISIVTIGSIIVVTLYKSTRYELKQIGRL